MSRRKCIFTVYFQRRTGRNFSDTSEGGNCMCSGWTNCLKVGDRKESMDPKKEKEKQVKLSFYFNEE
jgi:hypothetical protein